MNKGGGEDTVNSVKPPPMSLPQIPITPNKQASAALDSGGPTENKPNQPPSSNDQQNRFSLKCKMNFNKV